VGALTVVHRIAPERSYCGAPLCPIPSQSPPSHPGSLSGRSAPIPCQRYPHSRPSPTPATVAAFHHLQGELVKLNLPVKLAKCVAYSPAGIPAPLQLPPNFDRPAQSILALGVPIGSAAHIHDVVGAKLQIFAQQLSTLPMLQDLQVALALLTRVFVQRPSYLMRTVVPAPNFFAQLGEFDAQILQTLEELIGPGSFQGEVGELARMHASLPTSLGGLGVRSTARAPAAFLGSWALVGSLVRQHFLRSGLPFLVSMVSDDVDAGVLFFQVALRSARDGLPRSARPILAPFLELGRVSESRVQERLLGAVDIVASEALWDRLPTGDSAGRARLVSETGPGAAAWLTAIFLFRALQIEDECFRTALRTWLGLP
jgi:hypothetical protein